MNNRMFAFVAAVLMIAAPIAIVTLQDDDSDVEAITPGFWVGFVLGAVVGGGVGYFVGHVTSEGSGDQARAGEANALSTGLNYGTPQIATAMINYENIWTLTSEHWIRQAELATAANWTKDSQYDPYRILIDSSQYLNSAVLLSNSAAQLNKQFEAVSERVSDWGSYDDYKNGQMKFEIRVGDYSIDADSEDDFRVGMGTTVRNVVSGHDSVYIAGGPLYASKACSITSNSGHTITLKAGWNELGPSTEFAYADVYHLTPGVSYCGYMMSTIDSASAPLTVGLVATVNGSELFVTFNGSTLSTNGTNSLPIKGADGEYDGIKANVIPDGSSTQTCDITSVLDKYWALLRTIQSVQSDSNQAARVMWNIFNDAGESSAYMTSLSVPTTYENIKWTDDQKQMLNYLFMDQLADYWDKHSGQIKADGYEMTKGSMTLYCRGSVEFSGPSGSYSVSDGVAFTPIFYRDVNLTTGSNTIKDSGFIIIWGKCSSLGSFNVASMNDAQILYMPSGSKLNISEMIYDGVSQNTVNLECSEVEWVDPLDIKDPGPVKPMESSDLGELIRIVLIILGGALVVYGLGRGSMLSAIVGFILVMAGVMFAEDIADIIEAYTGLKWMWPSWSR